MIELDKDVYDTLELSALAFRGIGYGRYYSGCDTQRQPNCIVGHASWTGIISDPLRGTGELLDAALNDQAVLAYNAAHGRLSQTPLTWKQYCKQRNIVRNA